MYEHCSTSSGSMQLGYPYSAPPEHALYSHRFSHEDLLPRHCLAMLCTTTNTRITANTVDSFNRNPKCRHVNILFITPKYPSMRSRGRCYEGLDCILFLVRSVVCLMGPTSTVLQRTVHHLVGCLRVFVSQRSFPCVIL